MSATTNPAEVGAAAPPASATAATTSSSDSEPLIADLCLEDLCDGRNERGTVPLAKFIDDIDAFANSFRTVPASAELLIGAYNELHAKYKQMEAVLVQKSNRLAAKLPELDQSLALVQHLQQLQQLQQQQAPSDNASSSEPALVRYELADSIYGKAAIDVRDPEHAVVHLWLGANVMLEYTYDDAIQFLTTNRSNASRDLNILKDELALVRDQIVTTEVNTSRTYNWDVRQRRLRQQQQEPQEEKGQAPPPQPAPAVAALVPPS